MSDMLPGRGPRAGGGRRSGASISVMACAVAAWVQPALTQPTVVQPGGTASDQFQRPATPQSRPPATFRIVAPEGPRAVDEETRFRVDRILVEGGGALPADTIAAIVRPLEGRELGFRDLARAAERITSLYAASGYALSFASIPEQTVAGGTVRIRITEGTVDRIEVEFRDGLRPPVGRARIERAIRQRLRKLVGTGPVRSAALERAVLSVADLNGVDASVVVRPSDTQTGAATLRVIVGTRPLAAALGADNRLRSEFGREELFSDATFNSLGVVGDRLSLAARRSLDAHGFTYAAIGYESPIGTGLTRGYASFSRARTRGLDGLLGLLDYRGREDAFAAGVRHPLIRSRARTLTVSAELGGIDTSSSLFGVELVRDRIRTVSLGVSYDWADQTGAATLFTVNLVQGIDGLGATPRGNPLRSRALGVPDATWLQLRLYRDQPLAAGFRLRGSVETQVLVSGSLLAASECTYGGPAIGRAYDAGIITGDECVKASMEAARPIPVAGQVVEPYLFIDAGRAFQRGPLEFGEAGEARASAVGAGLRLFTRFGIAADAQVSQPLTRTFPGDSRDARFFFTLSFRR